MKLQNLLSFFLCPLLFTACIGHESRITSLEQGMNTVEEKVDALLVYSDKTHDAITDIDLRMEALERDAKRRGVPVRIRGVDLVSAKADLLRAQGLDPEAIRSRLGVSSSTSPYPSPQPLTSPASSAEKSADAISAALLQDEITQLQQQSKERQNITNPAVPPVPATPKAPVRLPQGGGATLPVQNMSDGKNTDSVGPITGQNLQAQALTPPPPVPAPVEAQQAIATAPIAPVPVVQAPLAPVAPAVAPSQNIQSAVSYDVAMNLYNNRRYQESEDAFNAFLEGNPSGPLAPNALYWKGETLYARGLYPQAIFAFKEVQTRYPKHSKVPDSLLKTAMSYSHLGDTENADLHYIVLKEDFPASSAARRAPR